MGTGSYILIGASSVHNTSTNLTGDDQIDFAGGGTVEAR